MIRYIAFLRAINVGGHIVKMVDLRQHFTALNFTDVQTYIQTGNVIFTSPENNNTALELQIEQHLQQTLGYAVTTFLRTLPELTAVAQYQPYPEAEFAAGANLYIAFLKQQPGDEAQRKLMTYQNEVDMFHIYQREMYWLCRKSLGTSTFSGALLEKALGGPATVRNVTTVRKMAAKYPVIAAS